MIFDISEDQLCQLDAAELRELVARLCQAELSLKRAPVSAVRWGGSNMAPDGGLDVEVCLKQEGFSGDFVPCGWTGIQVKKPSMPAGEIAAEMSSGGDLRPIISELMEQGGCYIIVSLADDPAGVNLRNREKAMRAQVASVETQAGYRLEFYGCGRLVDWLRQHPGVQLWVRGRLGLSLSGWKPHGRWSTSRLPVEDDLICEDGVSISLPGEVDKRGIVGGVNGIRDLVRSSGKAVRIVGLSGVGKSRLVHALFEENVGDDALDRHAVIYGDAGRPLEPSPQSVLEGFVAEGREVVMVLDNCPPDVHHQLANEVAPSSTVRLVTVEYDVREDKPEDTKVVRVVAEGTGVVEVLVRRRYPHLNQDLVKQIAGLSEGNARVALALANATSEAGDDSSALSDEDLFERLFWQRGERDRDFLEDAEALSLVYSFSVDDVVEGVDELEVLGKLVNREREQVVQIGRNSWPSVSWHRSEGAGVRSCLMP